MNGEKNFMKPDIEWVQRNYDEMNSQLFDGMLGECKFNFYNSGTKTLGRFRITGQKIKLYKEDRRMFYELYSGHPIYINHDNFVFYCKPSIELNLNYSATEEAWLWVLVHEMVHYYDYMFGICPKQAHGKNFRSIASVVSMKSNGRFNIKRLADAETMKNFELPDDIIERKKRNEENKKARAIAVFVYRRNGNIEMTLTSNYSVVDKIYNYYVNGSGIGKALEIITSKDPKLIEMLYDSGYRRLLRTWKYWNIKEKPWSNTIKDYEHKTLYLEESKMTKGKKNIIESRNIDVIIESVVEDYVGELEADSKNNDNNIVDISGIELSLYSPLEIM